MANESPDFVRLVGHQAFAERLVLATLIGRPVHISKIRSNIPATTGLDVHEISFMRLLDSVTNGGSFQISTTGSTVTYHPGLVTGSMGKLAGHEIIDHKVPTGCTRGVTYFLLPIALLAFVAGPISLRIHGPGAITASTECGDVSVDTFRRGILPVFGVFGMLMSQVDVRIVKQSFSGGNGEVEAHFHAKGRVPKTIHLTQGPGSVRCIRGVAYSVGAASTACREMILSARHVLSPLVADINVGTHHGPSSDGRKQGIGFGISLVAETYTDGIVFFAEQRSSRSGGIFPGDIGKQCAFQLLEAISTGGFATPQTIGTFLILMAVGSADIGRLCVDRNVIASAPFIKMSRDLFALGYNPVVIQSRKAANQREYMINVKGLGTAMPATGQ